MNQSFEPAYDATRCFDDVRRTAEAIDAPFDDTKVRTTLDVFDAELHRSFVQLKATSKPRSGLYYRFFGDWSGGDPIGTAQRHGLVHLGDAPVVALQREVVDKFSTAKRAGLDFDTSVGLAKSWIVLKARPIEEFFDLPAIPNAVRAHADFFVRHGLRRVVGVCCDYPGETMNLYPVVELDCRNEDWLHRLVEDTGGASEDAPDYREMIASLEVGACLGMTFSWNSPEMQRWALYGLNVPYLDPQASAALPTLPPRLKTFLSHASTLSSSPPINTAWSFGKAGFYTKLSVGGRAVSQAMFT